MALRRLRSFANTGVMPRLCPLIRTRVVSTPGAVDHGKAGPRIGQDFDLFEGRCQSVAVIRIAWKAVGANDEAAVEGGREADRVILSDVLVDTPNEGAVVVIGDSITDGNGTTILVTWNCSSYHCP